MHDNDDPKFKIRLDDDLEEEIGQTADEAVLENQTADPVEEKQRRYRRVSEPKPKSNLTGLLLAALTIAVVAGVYFSLKNQIASNTNAGATAVTSLSINFESRLTAIADAQEQLQKTLASDIESISSQVLKIEKSVNTVRTSKSDKTDVEKALADIEKKLFPVQKTLEEMKTVISGFEESTQKKLTGISESLTTHGARIDKTNTELASYASAFSRLNAEIAQLKAEKLGKTALDNSLKAENERYMTLINNLNRELSILKLRTKAIEDRQIDTSHRSSSALPEKKGDIMEQTIR